MLIVNRARGKAAREHILAEAVRGRYSAGWTIVPQYLWYGHSFFGRRKSSLSFWPDGCQTGLGVRDLEGRALCAYEHNEIRLSVYDFYLWSLAFVLFDSLSVYALRAELAASPSPLLKCLTERWE